MFSLSVVIFLLAWQAARASELMLALMSSDLLR